MEHNVKSFTQKTAACWMCAKRVNIKKQAIKCIDCCAYICADCVGNSHHATMHCN